MGVSAESDGGESRSSRESPASLFGSLFREFVVVVVDSSLHESRALCGALTFAAERRAPRKEGRKESAEKDNEWLGKWKKQIKTAKSSAKRCLYAIDRHLLKDGGLVERATAHRRRPPIVSPPSCASGGESCQRSSEEGKEREGERRK